tara:strand:+ start:318 stop:1403 length:1086 start_codon:yes stop_codon:yes gene_type:complete
MKTITLKLTPNNNRNMEECLKGSKWSTLCAILHQANLKPKDVGIEVLDSTSVGGGFTCDVLDIDKFRKFLNDEVKAIPKPLNEPSRIDYDNLKSILSKLYKVVVLNNLQKQITKVEEIDKDFCDMVAEGCNADEGDGQFYNGVRIDEDTILVLSTWYDRTSNSEDYFHYSISKNELIPVDAEMDEKYRELFEDCNMLDYTNCFYIVGIEPTKGKAKIVYGDEYNDTIVNLFDEPKCTKCGSKFEDEYWKTDGLEYEQYRCSNEDCQAIHTINIDRNDEEGGEVDIDRDWDTLEFFEFYICPASIKQIEETIKDEPQDFEGHCPKCDSDNLDNVSGGVDYTDMACDDCGHKFGIECKGWVIS